MAFTTKLHFLIVFVLLISLKMILPSECTTTGSTWSNNKGSTKLEIHHRKFMQILSDLKNRKRADSDKYEDTMEWDLRKVPAGPDPLHHNGGSPKKPRTP